MTEGMSEISTVTTGVVFSERFKEHLTGEGHPESPARMDAVRRALATPSLTGELLSLEPRSAERGRNGCK